MEAHSDRTDKRFDQCERSQGCLPTKVTLHVQKEENVGARIMQGEHVQQISAAAEIMARLAMPDVDAEAIASIHN